MRANRRSGTRPERSLRSQLHRLGLRFRKDFRIEVSGRKVRPDIVFTRLHIAVFLDGCFWHRCPEHASSPQSNIQFWEEKFRRNVARDRLDNAALEEAGWSVIRVWEHEHVADAAKKVELEVARRAALS
jgi:DNA mismatch endonuclease (patch repair protein)